MLKSVFSCLMHAMIVMLNVLQSFMTCLKYLDHACMHLPILFNMIRASFYSMILELMLHANCQWNLFSSVLECCLLNARGLDHNMCMCESVFSLLFRPFVACLAWFVAWFDTTLTWFSMLTLHAICPWLPHSNALESCLICALVLAL